MVEELNALKTEQSSKEENFLLLAAMVISGLHTTSSILKSFCMSPVACESPYRWGLE